MQYIYVVGSKSFRPDQLFKGTNKTTLLFFNIVSLYFNTLFNWYINLTIDDTIYPSQYFPFGSDLYVRPETFGPYYVLFKLLFIIKITALFFCFVFIISVSIHNGLYISFSSYSSFVTIFQFHKFLCQFLFSFNPTYPSTLLSPCLSCPWSMLLFWYFPDRIFQYSTVDVHCPRNIIPWVCLW